MYGNNWDRESRSSCLISRPGVVEMVAMVQASKNDAWTEALLQRPIQSGAMGRAGAWFIWVKAARR
jgi:hypothetical protein